MTIDEAVQNAYMEPDLFKQLSVSEIESLSNKIIRKLNKIKQVCPQSQTRDCTLYQYQYSLRTIEHFIH